MKKLFTLVALLAMFMGAKAEELVDAFVDFSTVTEIPRFSWGGSESAFARLSLQDGCLHFHSEEATDPSWDCQFFPIGGVDAEAGVTYTLHYKVKGDHNGNVSMLGFGQTPYGQFAITTDWVEGTVDYECTEANGNILMQCGDWVGDWDIAYLKITHEGKAPTPVQWKELLENGDAEKTWESLGLADVAFDDMENNMKVCFWTKEKGVNEHNPHVAEIIEEANGNHAFICRATLADTEGDPSAWDNQVWLQSPRAWKTGEQFRIMFRYKASEPVVTNTQLHKQKPSDYLHWVGVGDVSFTTEWQEFEQVVTVPSDGNGMWSIAFNLNPNVKTPVDFYIDDISWGEMVLDHGLFIAAGNKEKALDMDFDNAIEFVYDDAMEAMAATVGTAGKEDSWVKELMISTVRGNDRQFKANTLKTKGTILPLINGDEWINYEEASNATITLPGAGVWNVYVDTENGVMAFEQVEGEEVVIEPDEEIVPNPTEFVINAVERDWKPAKEDGTPQDGEEGIGEGQPWDNQFFLIGKRALEVGEEVFVAFDYMATAPATVGTQNSQNAGTYLHWAGLGNIEFTTEWQHFEATVTIPSETAGKQNSWTFNLSNAKAANEYHIKNIIFCNAEKTHSLIDMVTGNEDNFQKKIGANTGAIPASIKEVNINKVTTNAMYNLAGQRVSKEYKGIAVKNGQKFIVK
ncbi:MAG: hypothetical protein MJZ32_01585 [Bacteroidaceae bacterium]|nr:hypothetical protein [Bacteroidaceae bacterium]